MTNDTGPATRDDPPGGDGASTTESDPNLGPLVDVGVGLLAAIGELTGAVLDLVREIRLLQRDGITLKER